MSPTRLWLFSHSGDLKKEIVMPQPKVRRALAVLTLAFAAAFATVSGAGAAVHPQGARPAHVRAVKTPRISWLAAAASVLEKIGVRIDPDGHS
jgi:hypothetical protein